MGYQIGVTPLQMVAAVSSVANGGELVAPRLVRAVIADGQRIEVPRRVVRRTITADTAADADRRSWSRSSSAAPPSAARIDGYTIAGKTGTAAKLVDGRYSKSEYNASFVGFLPSRQPRVTIIAVIDSPHGNGYTGGVVAAPLFKRDRRSDAAPPGRAAERRRPPPVLVARHDARAGHDAAAVPAAPTSMPPRRAARRRAPGTCPTCAD